jgi:hypothetical protein
MKVTKTVKTEENKNRTVSIDLKNTKSAVWNNRRRFGI